MTIFPQLSMKTEVREHLHSVFTRDEVVSEVGNDEAERLFEALLNCLSHPPMFTCVRASTHLQPLPDIQHRLLQHLVQQDQAQRSDFSQYIHTHPQLPDVLLLPVLGPRSVDLLGAEVVVGAQCGNAVLRGANVFTPGVLSTPKYMKVGDVVSVFSDVEGKCTRGAKEFHGKKVFLGNGVVTVDRAEIFHSEGPTKGLAIRMTEPLFQSPSFDGVLTHEVFLQNLPSVVVGHVLDPQPGEQILDMCAAPGGKTTHIAALMGNQGTVVALEKCRSKLDKITQNAKTLNLDCIKVYCYNSVKAVTSDPARGNIEDGPPYPEESFDRILLDAPCSGLGQRPNMSYNCSLKEVCSYQPLQRKLLTTAVGLLRRGGVLVYSTCTVTLAENEEQVLWALRTFPCLTLEQQVPVLGSEGMPGAGLSREQRRLLQRFRPELVWRGTGFMNEGLHHTFDTDTIGFFIAKFRKR